MAAAGGGQMVAVVFVFVVCFEMTLEMRYAAGSTDSSPEAASATAQISDSDGVCTSMAKKYGYECQEHTVTTEDGYILGIQRIPQGLTNNTSGSRTPVLLQHGLMMDAVTWLMSSPQESLAYILADSGYDVWIANCRGMQWSRGHTSLDSNNQEYWNWSWDELATYDLPAFVQYIYDQTKQKLNYVGHSQGTLMSLASLSQRKLLDKLKLVALLSPIAHMGLLPSPISQAIAREFYGDPTYWLGVGEINTKGEDVSKLLAAACKNTGADCADMMTAFTGKNCCIKSSTVATFLEHEPQSTSAKNVMHFAQSC